MREEEASSKNLMELNIRSRLENLLVTGSVVVVVLVLIESLILLSPPLPLQFHSSNAANAYRTMCFIIVQSPEENFLFVLVLSSQYWPNVTQIQLPFILSFLFLCFIHLFRRWISNYCLSCVWISGVTPVVYTLRKDHNLSDIRFWSHQMIEIKLNDQIDVCVCVDWMLWMETKQI